MDASRDADASETAAPDTNEDVPACPVRCGPFAMCCAAGEECVIDQCLPICAGTRCGPTGEICCVGEDLCVNNACVTPGAPCDTDSNCSTTEACEPLVGRCIPLPVDSACEFLPPEGVFAPQLEWTYDRLGALSTPLVVQLTDDNMDGAIDGNDMPDIVALLFSRDAWTDAHLIALAGDTGETLFRSTDAVDLCGGQTPAAGDVDGDGHTEIFAFSSGDGACTRDSPSELVAYNDDLSIKWRVPAPHGARYAGISVADLDGDGMAEIIGGGHVFDTDGTVLWTKPELSSVAPPFMMDIPTVADVDGDGRMEIVTSNVVFNDDGSELWRAGSVDGGYTAIANVIPSSPGPQVVALSRTHLEILDGATGATLFGPILYNPLGGLVGPPTVADFDGDGGREIGAASGDLGYVVFDPTLAAPHILWTVPTEDVSNGSVGSTVFDFDGNGTAEVILGDECHIRILSGVDGSLLWWTHNTSAKVLEYSVVADVDNDGNAELVVPANRLGIADTRCLGRALPVSPPMEGIRVYGDRLDNWVPTRSVWNQHTYHVDNINDDGRTIPANEAPSWETHNTYRLNQLIDPRAIAFAPDLTIGSLASDVGSCPSVVLRARVANLGTRGVPPGVQISFFLEDASGAAVFAATATTATALLPGNSEWVEVTVSVTLDAEMKFRFLASADNNGVGAGEHNECHEDNNGIAAVEVMCTPPG